MKKSRITARDVAAATNVSVSAVSRAFTDGASVSLKTRKKILKAAEKLNYRPNALARSLMTQRSDLIGIISTNFRNPAFMEIFERFTIALQNRKLRPLIFNMTASMNYKEALDLLIEYRADAVIVASSTLPLDFFEAFETAEIPGVVAFGRSLSPSVIGSVAADNVGGGHTAAKMLLSRGYTRIGFLGGPPHATTTIDRLCGFRAELDAHDLPIVTDFADSYSHAEGMRVTERFLVEYPDIEVLFCGDDIIATGAYDHIKHRLGRRVPEDIGILGFNDMSMAKWPAYDLTTIRQPFEQIVENAVSMICEQIDKGGTSAQTRLIACEPVLRGSLRA